MGASLYSRGKTMTEVKALTITLVTGKTSLAAGEDLARYFENQLPNATMFGKKLKFFVVNEPGDAIARMIQAEPDGVMLLLGVEISQEDTETLEVGFEFKVMSIKDRVPALHEVGNYAGKILTMLNNAFRPPVDTPVADTNHAVVSD
jgi:hypothetical protein